MVSDGDNVKDRSLAKITVSLVDRFGNACTEAGLQLAQWGPFAQHLEIGMKCRITRAEDVKASNATLKFENCDADGWVSSTAQEWVEGGNKFHFKNLTVENNPRVQDGRFDLQFKATLLGSSLDPGIESEMLSGVSDLVASIDLITNREQIAEERRKQDRITELEQLLTPKRDRRDELRGQQEELKAAADASDKNVRTARDNIPKVYKDAIKPLPPADDTSERPKYVSSKFLSERLATWNQQHKEAIDSARSEGRPAIKTSTNNHETSAQVDNLKPHGQVVDLGFFEEKRVAELVSWAFQSSMGAVVVDNKEQTEECFNLGAKSIALELIYPYQRNNTDRRRKILPYPKLGDIRYVVNEVQLLTKDENLRESLFYDLFRQTIIFETMEEMNEFKQYCVQIKQRHPMILVIKEGIKSSGGLLDPSNTLDKYMERNVKQGKPPIPYVFGSMPNGDSTKNTPLMKACNHGKEMLDNLIVFESKKQEWDAFNQMNENEMTELEHKVQQMENELSELRDGESTKWV